MKAKNMKSVIAFFDDSGELDPSSGRDFVCLGMVALSICNVREICEKWLNMVARHLRLEANILAINGIEAKCGDLHELSRRLRTGKSPEASQLALYNWGLNTPQKVDDLIEDSWDFLSAPSIELSYLATIANKPVTLQRFLEETYQRFKEAKEIQDTHAIKNLRRELVSFIGGKLFEYLLQRLNYLGNPSEWGFENAFIVGDENAVTALMYKSQAQCQAGLRKYTNLPKICNNIWFGSSAHNPSIQIADWIAYAIRTWAERRQKANMRLSSLLPHFRGYPDVMGVGIVAIPDETALPKLPK